MKNVFILLIAVTPFNILRILLYRVLLGYNISSNSYIGPFNIIIAKKIEFNKAYIGYFNYINCNELLIKEAKVLYFNIFLRVNKIIINKYSKIGRSNIFLATKEGVSPFKANENLFLGEKVIITKNHSIDISDTIKIGDDVTFAGQNIEVWTHGFDLEHVMITSSILIGNKVYIGSSSIINPGINICDNVSIAAGTIVSKNITEPGFYVSSNLIRKSDNRFFKSMPNTEKYHDGFIHRK